MPRIVTCLLALVLAAAAGWTAGVARSAYSASTATSGSTVTAGTVALEDDDDSSALYSIAGMKPGDSVERCLRVRYTGSLGATVALSTPSTPGAAGAYVRVRIEAGSRTGGATFPSCTGFSAGPQLFTGTLDAFAAAHGTSGTPLDTAPSGKTTWAAGDEVVYRFTISLPSATPDAARGLSTGAHTFRWRSTTP